MGYTHYWTQTRDFTREEWSQIVEDFEALLKDVSTFRASRSRTETAISARHQKSRIKRSGSTAPATTATRPSA